MSIPSQQNNPDKWKDKYFDLLDEIDSTEKAQQAKEALLCKTIIRLSLATTGFNRNLDPHLTRIRTQLKNGLKSEKLKAELESFTSAIMTLDEIVPDESIPDASLLFNFLFQHFPEQKQKLQKIEVKFEKNEYPNSEYLFVAINDLIDSIQSIEPLANAPGFTEKNASDNTAFESINKQLHQLLESTEIPEIFTTQVEVLKMQLEANAPLVSTLNETVDLLFQIKKHFQSEHQEITDYLTQLTDQLTTLKDTTSDAHTRSLTNEEKKDIRDHSVSLQMTDLKIKSKNATQLEPLKQLINTRLTDIAQQIATHQTEEIKERQKMQQELEQLNTKISLMEHESDRLNEKLSLAHEKATHDPLTKLPNRLAYDSRLKIELARFKRYKTPLCLLIWDIDFFKKINDSYGHKAGDKTLILIAKLLSHYCRDTDFVSRFGGEEFTMLLSNSSIDSALLTANKLREVIEQTAFNSSGKKISITISCGITQFTNHDTGETAFKRADKALYKAKNNGRNQCVSI